MEAHLDILLIDNYDSFTYNLVETLRSIDSIRLHILKNDDLSIFRDDYDAIIISPGPGLPSESAFLLDALDFYVGKIPIFGICLGLQAITEHYGGQLNQLKTVFHGIKDSITKTKDSPIFENIPQVFDAGRYHSWVANENQFPSQLEITALDSKGSIMAIQNIEDNCYAVQFHPESYMTKHGHIMFENFIALVKNKNNQRMSCASAQFL